MNDIFMGLAGFLGTYLIHSTVLVGGVMLFHATRRAGSATLEALYRTALLAPVLTTALSVNLAVEPLAGTIHWFETREEIVREIGPVSVAGGNGKSAGPAMPVSERRAERSPVAPPPAPEAAGPVAPAPARAGDVHFVGTWSGMRELAGFLAAAWLLVALATTLRWVRGALEGRRLLAARRPLASGPAHEALLRLTDRAGVAAPALSHCDELGGPATLPSGEICIPGWALDLPAGQLEAMLAHELAHVERRDPWWLATAVALESLFWIQPLNRLARHRLAGLAEFHADARAARLIEDGRALAHCLAHCAERLNAGRMPVLAAAMARRGGALSERVRKLMSHSTETGGISMSRKFMIFAGVIALVMVLPSVAVLANKGKIGQGTSVNIHENDNGARTMSLSFSDDDMRLKLKASGDFVFAPDDSGLEHMGAGAALDLIQEAGGTKRRLVADGTSGGIDYTFYVDGEERPFDADARAWFADILPMVMRETAINAPERVEYILANDGHDGVIDEIAKIRSDFARRHYVEAYVATGDLPGGAYDRLIGETAKIGSDFELRHALAIIYDTQRPRGPQLASLIEAAAGIGSDFEMRQLLGGIAEDAVADEAVMTAYARAADGIGSDFELRQALQALMEAGRGPRAVEIALPVADDIGSDFEMRSLLDAAAPLAVQSDAASRAWLDAAATIGSDFELRQALSSFAARGPASPATWQALLEAAKGIGSDHECASFLVTAAGHMPDDPAVEAAFRSVMETIGSDSDYRRVAKAIGG